MENCKVSSPAKITNNHEIDSATTTDKNQRKRKIYRESQEEEATLKMLIHPHKNMELTVINGIRYLAPYWGCFKGFAKQRWIGRTVEEVFTNEFICYHPLYARAAIHRGRVFINGRQMCDPGYRFRTSDRFVHITHRHETEIPALPIGFIDETDDYLVIDKPPGLPVHPCGHYNLHSVMSLLANEYGRTDSDKLRPLYRLDRNTTGVLMFAKNYKADLKFKNAIRERKMRKEYLAKVEGIFPEGEIVCKEPIGILSPATGIRKICADGQDSLSRFSRICADPISNTSIICCRIETGRTHQIRVHLQFLGFPLVNDNIYNDLVWGPAKGKGCDYGEKSLEQLITDVGNRHNKKHWILATDSDYERRIAEIASNDQYVPEEIDLKTLQLEQLPNPDPICWNCAIIKKREMTELDWLMPLHCWRYSADDWSFETPLPEWARDAAEYCQNQKQQKTIPLIEAGEQNGGIEGKEAFLEEEMPRRKKAK